MRVLIINTSERTGGAAIAANRLMEALRHNGVKASMLVRDKQTSHVSVVAVKSSWRQPLRFVWERFVIWMNNALRMRNIWQVDIANTGTDVTQLPEFIHADVIHLHWVNQGFLSLADLQRIVESGKPVVVTMHDMWYFTGICHYSSDCERYTEHCTRCPLLTFGGVFGDLASRVFDRKRRIYGVRPLTFVGCSQWMADLASRSALAQGHRVLSIPNAIDTELFAPVDRAEARRRFHLPADRQLLLFSAQRITDERKGFSYLAEACSLLVEADASVRQRLAVVVVGGDSEKVRSALPLDVFPISYVSSQEDMVQLYNAVDVYVTPSLQDNLPNTIVEAMACGVPCVGFHVGGIPEMIDHETNGFVAEYRNAASLSECIARAVDASCHEALSAEARRKALSTYSEKAVAARYTNAYEEAMKPVK